MAQDKQNGNAPRVPVLGNELTPNKMWYTMSIKKFGTNYVITEACNACSHTIVRTFIETDSTITNMSMVVVPNFNIKETTNNKNEKVVVFSRGL